ncbi:MAG: glycoside hydrolase family 3 C-terminal domain-containing protein [Bacteroidia bacterium]
MYHKALIIALVAFCFAITSCNQQPKVSWVDKKVDSFISIMTVEEKIGQMSQVRHFSDMETGDVKAKLLGSVIHTDGPTPGTTVEAWRAKFKSLQDEALSTRLGIPLLIGVDAVHGQNTFDGATIFPHNIGLGATHNTKLVEDIAKATAKECIGTGFNWTFSPCAAIPMNEKWGRVYEAFSEDAKLSSSMVAAMVRGLQGKLNGSSTIMATAKHFIADGATDYGVEGGNSTVPVNVYKDVLLPPYTAAIEQNVGAIMASFNNYHDVNMHAHKAMITDSLKVKYGFEGMVISDWKGYSRFGKADVVNAGLDMLMAVDGDLDLFQSEMKQFIEDGTVSMDRLDDAVKRILKQKIKLGLFKNPYPSDEFIASVGSDEHRNLAKQAVRESLVLLKNEDKTLPLAKESQKIVVVGEHANNTGLQSGGWTVSWQGKPENYKNATTILDGIKAMAQGEVVYDTMAQNLQVDADVAIIVVGEKPYAEFMGDIGKEGYDNSFYISDAHKKYIDAYNALGVKTVVVLISGRPLVVTEDIEKSNAFIAAWLLGSEGDGVAEVLFGDYNFTGTLPHTWPKSEENFKGLYGPNHWDQENNGLFELGYGLKYE